jgi:hypothetical protein
MSSNEARKFEGGCELETAINMVLATGICKRLS